MGKSTLLFGLMLATTPAVAFAQVTGGSRDGTNNVRSDSLGTPTPTTDPMTQYQQRQGLQDLNQAARNEVAKLGPSRPARKEELIAGAAVNDKTGAAMAKVESIDPDGIVLSMGVAKVKVPADAFGHNKAGLLLDMTKAQFEQLVAQANKAS